MGTANIYDAGLGRNAANYVPLSPLSFLDRTSRLYPDRKAWIDGEDSCTWSEFFMHCKKLASALRKRGIERGDTVAALLFNTPEMLELHFGVPASGAVLNTINTRLDAAAIAFILEHGEAKIVFFDHSLAPQLLTALAIMAGDKPYVVEVGGGTRTKGCDINYQSFVGPSDADFEWNGPVDEWDAIALNYTSGTTGDPKGVVVHHRGAYLNAVTNALSMRGAESPVYLWTLPMFHCNGWCFPWTLALVGGTSVCLRKVEPKAVFAQIELHGVTHMCGAPIVYNMLLSYAAKREIRPLRKITGLLGGAAPPATVIAGCAKLGIEIIHVYGLTEVYGPSSICVPQPEWADKPLEERAALMARQGITAALQEDMAVLDPETLSPVPADGQTVGEIFFRGNVVMKGYLKNPDATQKAFAGGWFHTGDLAVCDPDFFIRVVDRSKDIIISGGENISSLEVEDVLYKHPAILFAAVVAKPDDRWGEVPCAFIELAPGETATDTQITEFCQAHLARFKAPKDIRFTELPKTSTGKIQKFLLRQAVRQNHGQQSVQSHAKEGDLK